MKQLFLSFFLCLCGALLGQYNTTIRGARPSNVIGAFTVGKGVLQFQQGVDYVWGENERYFYLPEPSPGNGFNGAHQLENTISQNVIRFGILEKLEISAALNYNWKNEYYQFENSNDPALQSGNSKSNVFQNIDLGFRYNILDGTNKQKLAWGIQARASLYQWVFEDIVRAPNLKIVSAVARNFGKHHSVRLNVGTTIVEFDGASLVYGVNYVFRPIPKMGITLEYSGEANLSSISPTSYDHKYLAAVHYLVYDDVQVDVRAGINNKVFSFFPKTYYIGAGISWRVRTTKR